MGHLCCAREYSVQFFVQFFHTVKVRSLTESVHSFSILSYDRSKASPKAIPPHSVIYSFLIQMRVSSPVLKAIQ